MRLALLYFFLWIPTCCNAQPPSKIEKPEPTNSFVEQQLENITDNSEGEETEDDTYLQQMLQYQKHPLNVNYATEADLKSLRLATPIQIKNLLAYRNLLGLFLNFYELQAIPMWDVATLQKIKPYILVNKNADILSTIADQLSGGDHSFLLRITQVLEKSKGFSNAPTSGANFYPGSPQRLFMRYRYQYKNSLQYGLVGEKDQGEQFFKGSQKQGFDFYSAHFFMRNAGIVKALALGDYTVNMGQGLTQWMSLAFKKSPDVVTTKRESAVLRPYNSAGEIAFHRGVGITLGKKNWEATVFGSYRNIDANFAQGDTNTVDDDFVTSLQTSGFHRTKAEVADKGIQTQLAFGGNVAYQIKRIHIGLNAIQYQLKYPLLRTPEPYNLFAISGSQFGNYSTDYSYTYKNLHFFGEAAITNKQYTATVNGLLLSVANNIDISMVYRNIAKGYQALYSNAFTESSTPTNEKGLFTGITIRPTIPWRIDAYVDYYKFPWLKFRINAPTTGADYLVQFTYKPSRVFEMYCRFKAETKSINYNPKELATSPVVPQPKQNWRTQFSYKVHPSVTIRSRVEAVWYDNRGDAAETGFLLYGDLLYKPMMKPFAASIRVQYFETDGFNSRLYAYENDVLYSFSIPVFFDKGYRYYLNMNYDLTKKITFWARIAQLYYPNKNTIGSGLDEIPQNHRTEVKLQGIYKF